MILPILGFVVWLIFRATRSAKPASLERSKTISLTAAIFVWGFGLAIALQAVGELSSGNLSALPRLLASLLVLFPWPVLRLLVLPLGLVRTAYYLSFLCTTRFDEDRRGSALLLGAWALLQAPARGDKGDAATLRFLDKRLQRPKLRGAGVVAAALVAARRDELEVTRALLRSIANLDPTACPAFAYLLAREWLSVDAVARGDWAEVGALGEAWGPSLPLTCFLGDCAARFVPPPSTPASARPAPAAPHPAPTLVSPARRTKSPSNLRLSWHWLRAPYREATWPLLQRALRSVPKSAADSALPKSASASPSSRSPDLRAALGELVTLLNVPSRALTVAELIQLCRTWDAVLADSETYVPVALRVLALGQGDPDAALRELRAQVADLIATCLRDSGLPIGELLDEGNKGAPSLAATAAQAVRSQLLEEIEQACDALHDRTTSQRALPLLDEWREWATLLSSYRRVCSLGGLATRRLAWGPFHRHACNWAVWLWNVRHEKVLANAVFRYLLSESEELQDDSRLELDRKNVGSGI